MKKLVLLLILFIFPFYVFAGTADTIDEMVKEKLEKIRNSKSKGGSFVTEIKIDKNKSKTKKTVDIKAKDYGFDMGNLAIMNMVGGFFEGAAIGTGVGTIGYSQTKSRDINPLINGAIIGGISGTTLAGIMSIVEAATGRYHASTEYGFSMILWPAGGAFLGAAAGSIIYAAATEDGSDVIGSMGIGMAGGALLGLAYATIQTFNSEADKGVKYKGHALNMFYNGRETIITCKFDY